MYTLFLILTTQRSGSTWTCSLFNAMENVTCSSRRSEQMLHYMSYSNNTVGNMSWGDWLAEFTRGYERTSQEAAAAGQHAGLLGWKLMYNQIPAHLLVQFFRMLRDRRIAVVHLVREASVMRLVSLSDVVRRGGVYHALTKERRDPVRLPKATLLRSQLLETVTRMEALVDTHADLLRVHGVIHHRLSYELLIGCSKLELVRSAVWALGGAVGRIAMDRVEYVALGLYRCGERIANLEEVTRFLSRTRSVHWCRVLDEIASADCRAFEQPC